MRHLIVVTLLLAGGAARAERPPSPVLVDPWIDGTVLGFGLGLWLAPGLLKDRVEHSCDPCDPRTLNALDRPVVHFHSHAADVASDVLVVAVPTLAVAGTLGNLPRWGWRGVVEDVVLIAESMVVSGVLHQAVRFSVQRSRPFMYRDGARPELREDGDASLSFFSGHTTAAFSAASAFAYTYSLRHPRSHLRPLVWVAALLAAATVPVMRVGSGEHFWTDVMVGAAVGSGVGVLVPALHRRRAHTRLTVAPSWVALESWF